MVNCVCATTSLFVLAALFPFRLSVFAFKLFIEYRIGWIIRLWFMGIFRSSKSINSRKCDE